MPENSSHIATTSIPPQLQPPASTGNTGYVAAIQPSGDAPDKSTGLTGNAKIVATLGVVGAFVALFGMTQWAVLSNLGSNQAGAATTERLVDKFGSVLDRHDQNFHEWLRIHGETIRVESEKTRQLLSIMDERQDAASKVVQRLHEQQLSVLRQIRDEKKP